MHSGRILFRSLAATGIVVTVLLAIRPVMSATGSSTVPRLFVASGLFVLLGQSGR